MPHFIFAPAFLALPAAALALFAIYWLRNRFLPLRVSSLFLWMHQREAKESGLTLHRLQTPLLFFLEFLVLALIVTAAATPMMQVEQASRPLIIILDDSWSMGLGGADSPREKALRQLKQELSVQSVYPVRFILADQDPEFLGTPARNEAEARSVLENWRCRAAGTDIPAAINLAEDTLAKQGRILVISDQAPPFTLENGSTRWLAFGLAKGRVALVNACRGGSDQKERLLLEVTNFSGEVRSPKVILTLDGQGQSPVSVDLKPWESRRVTFTISSVTSQVEATIEGSTDPDAHITLLPKPPRPVKIFLSVKNGTLKYILEKGLAATGRIQAAEHPDLVFTDDQAFTTEDSAWVIKLYAAKEAESFVSPYVVDTNHPLMDGVNLAGLIWGAGRQLLPGRTILSVGNVPLLTEEDLSSGKTLHLKLRPDLSTLPQSLVWPIFLYNLVDWRSRYLAGPEAVNVRLGQEISFAISSDVDQVQGIAPDTRSFSLPAFSHMVSFRASEVGQFSLTAGNEHWKLAVNALQPRESNLASATAGDWGTWLDAVTIQTDYRPMTDVILVLALFALLLHQIAILRRPKGVRL